MEAEGEAAEEHMTVPQEIKHHLLYFSLDKSKTTGLVCTCSCPCGFTFACVLQCVSCEFVSAFLKRQHDSSLSLSNTQTATQYVVL